MSRPLLGVLLGAWLLGGAGPAAAERGEDGTLRLLFWQAPTTLNPHWADASKDWAASRIVYEPLASVDAAGYLVPFLAAEAPSLDNGGVASDGRSVTWKLKQGVKWGDGAPFTADDVVFTYEYITNPAVGATSGYAYEAIDRVEAIDDHTVTIHFKKVDPAWALPFVGRTGMIIPRHLFEPYSGENAKQAPANRRAIGTGPYRVASYQEEDLLIIGDEIVNTVKVVYEINPHYREPDKPHFARVELRGGGDAGLVAAALFEAGGADYAHNLQVDIAELEALEALGEAHLILPQSASVERIMFNFADPNHVTADGERANIAFPHPILSDRRVREALSYAIDRETISALYGRAGPITSNVLIAPKTYASPNTSWSYDLERAAALLDEAGWTDSDGDGVRDKNGMSLRLVLLTSVNDVRQQTQQIIREDLAKIGVAIRPKIVDSSILYGPVFASTNTWRHFYADLQMYSWWNNNPEPDDYLRQWLCAEAMQQANNWSSMNDARYCNPAYDSLYERMSTELDPNRRRALLIAMNDLLIEDVALIPLVERRNPFGVSNQIALGREPIPWDLTVWGIADWHRRQPEDPEEP